MSVAYLHFSIRGRGIRQDDIGVVRIAVVWRSDDSPSIAAGLLVSHRRPSRERGPGQEELEAAPWRTLRVAVPVAAGGTDGLG